MNTCASFNVKFQTIYLFINTINKYSTTRGIGALWTLTLRACLTSSFTPFNNVNSVNSAFKPLPGLPNMPKLPYIWDILIL